MLSCRSARAERVDLRLQQTEDLRQQETVGDGVIEPDAHRHHQMPVLLAPAAPVDDRREEQIAVRQLEVQRVIGQPGDVRGVEPVRMARRVQRVFPGLRGALEILRRGAVKAS